MSSHRPCGILVFLRFRNVLELVCDDVKNETQEQTDVIDGVIDAFNKKYGTRYIRTMLQFGRSALDELSIARKTQYGQLPEVAHFPPQSKMLQQNTSLGKRALRSTTKITAGAQRSWNPHS
jgi:hypothetical protein